MINPGIYTGIFLLYSGYMLEIIPAIIAKNFQELREKIKLVDPYVDWVHVDIMDGKFVQNRTWNNPEELSTFETPLFFEAHLMTEDPKGDAVKWIKAGIKRLIFHIEATNEPQNIIDACHEKSVEAGIAINPETPLAAINNVMQSDPVTLPDMVLVMGVTPGFGGQEFKPEIIPKIRKLRKLHPNLTIGVDGGMNPKTAKLAFEAGANIIVAGSYILGSKDIEKAINELENL